MKPQLWTRDSTLQIRLHQIRLILFPRNSIKNVISVEVLNFAVMCQYCNKFALTSLRPKQGRFCATNANVIVANIVAIEVWPSWQLNLLLCSFCVGVSHLPLPLFPSALPSLSNIHYVYIVKLIQFWVVPINRAVGYPYWLWTLSSFINCKIIYTGNSDEYRLVQCWSPWVRRRYTWNVHVIKRVKRANKRNAYNSFEKLVFRVRVH